MNKILQKVIGQREAKTALSEIIEGRKYALKRKKPFMFPPALFTGLSGVGKTHLAIKFAEALKDEGFHFEEVPIKAGWRYFDQLAQRTASIDDLTDLAMAIPAVIFVDEAHEPSPIEEQIKLITNIKKPRMFERNGTRFYADPSQHAWIFASNEEVDPALKNRCLEIPFEPYNQGEKKDLLTAMCDKSIHEQAVDYIESRTKPVARDIEQVSRRLNLQPVDRIKIDTAKTVIKNMGLFPQGLVRKDLELLLRMGHDARPTRMEALKAKIGDVKTSATRNRLGWLQALDLCEVKRGGYALTKQGVSYLKTLAELQAKEKKQRR